MSYRFRDLVIERIGVVGSGNIGPDIALFFAKAFHPHGVPVVVVDVSADAVARGRAKAEAKIAKGRESGAFKPDAADAMLRALTFTTDYAQLAGASLVIEAATENLDIKRKIFAQLESLCGPHAILASNSSHIEPEEIFGGLAAATRARTAVIHYFFPAERNLLVEIVPGRDTDPARTKALMGLYEEIGKIPVLVGGRFGYAVNPVFEGLFLAAALAVGRARYGQGGRHGCQARARARRRPVHRDEPHGRQPHHDHSLDVMTSKIGPWFRSPRLMKEAMASGKPWDVPKRDEKVELTPDQSRKIGDTMLGAYFGLAGEILDSGIITLADLELGVETGLAMRAPFSLMNEMGVEHALALVEAYAAGHPGFPVPKCIVAQARAGRPFRIEQVIRRDEGDVAVLTIRRPRVLNALNDDVYEQLAPTPRRCVTTRRSPPW